MKKENSLGIRMWLFVILIGFAGQMAWSIENMYLNTYIAYLNFSSPAGQGIENYSTIIAITTAASAIVATLTTILMGALTDKVGKRKYFISIGYMLWGISTAAFGLFNVNSSRELLPIAMTSTMAAIWVVILDCVMTFFGSTSNDAAFSSYVTKNISNDNKGKVEGVLEILPLVAMLLIFVILNGFTVDSQEGVHDAQWDIFFYLIGALVMFMGILSFFLIPKEKEDKGLEREKQSYLKTVTQGFLPSTIKQNKSLYLVFLIYFVYATANQVFFPYLMIYLQRTCHIANTGSSFLTPFAIVMALALVLGSVASVIFGFLSDKFGKNKMIFPVFLVFGIGIFLMFFITEIAQDMARTIYAAIAGTIMITGYVGVPTIVNALVKEKIPAGKEGSFMGVRMIFVVALPMCIGPFIGDALNNNLGSGYVDDYGNPAVIPTRFGYLVGLGLLLLAIVPILFYFRMNQKEKQIATE